jgi:hypothetical protein
VTGQEFKSHLNIHFKKSTYPLLLIIWVLPVRETSAVQDAPTTMPCTKTADVIEHGQETTLFSV